MEKLNSRWGYGILVGVMRRSGEVWLAFEDKILSASSVRRIPVKKRWGEDRISRLTGSHGIGKEALDADGEMHEDDGKRWYSEGRFNFVR